MAPSSATKPGGHKQARVTLVSLNVRRNYALALYYLKLYALQDQELRDRVAFRILEQKVERNPLRIVLKIALTRPHLVGFSCNVWNIEQTLTVITWLHILMPWVVIVVGGQEITHSHIDYLERNKAIDIAVDGEGEETFRRILRSYLFEKLANLEEIPGVSFRNKGRRVVNPPGPLIQDLDSIPSPYLNDEVEIKRSNHLGIMIETSRGCPFRCSFCFEGHKYSGVRHFSMSRIEREVARAVAKGVRHFHFLDPIVGNSNESRLRQLDDVLSRHLAACGRYQCSVEVYAELISESTVHLLQHFMLFDVGLQSINPKALRVINRAYARDRFINGVKLLQTLRRHINIYLLLGLPEDDFFSFLEGVRFTYSLNIERLFINLLCVLNGTELRTEAERLHLKYSKKPPYSVISNETFDESELTLAEVFSHSIMKEHDALANP